MMDNNLQYKAGDVVTLKVVRVSDMGAFLDAGTGDTSDDILLHKLQQTTPVNAGDEVRVYLYLDPHKRLTAGLRESHQRDPGRGLCGYRGGTGRVPPLYGNAGQGEPQSKNLD